MRRLSCLCVATCTIVVCSMKCKIGISRAGNRRINNENILSQHHTPCIMMQESGLVHLTGLIIYLGVTANMNNINGTSKGGHLSSSAHTKSIRISTITSLTQISESRRKPSSIRSTQAVDTNIPKFQSVKEHCELSENTYYRRKQESLLHAGKRLLPLQSILHRWLHGDAKFIGGPRDTVDHASTRARAKRHLPCPSSTRHSPAEVLWAPPRRLTRMSGCAL
jgi:hypothetical protein